MPKKETNAQSSRVEDLKRFQELEQILGKLHTMTLKKLLKYAKVECDLELPEENGPEWVRLKISYHECNRIYAGNISDKAKERMEDLDKEENITTHREAYQNQKEENDMSAKKTVVKKTTTKKATAPKATTITKDEHGFRTGSKGSNIFALLTKKGGTTVEALKKAGGAAVPGFIAGVKKDYREKVSAARSAVIETSGAKIQITTYVDKAGKTHKTNSAFPVKKVAAKKAVPAKKATAKAKGNSKSATV